MKALMAALVAAVVTLSGCASSKQDDWCPAAGQEHKPTHEKRAESYWRHGA